MDPGGRVTDERIRRLLLAGPMLIVGLMPLCATAGTPEEVLVPSARMRVVPGLVVIKAKSPEAVAPRLSAGGPLGKSLALNGAYSVEPFFPAPRLKGLRKSGEHMAGLSRIFLAKISHDADPRAAAKGIAACGDVEYAEPLFEYPILDLPSDSLLPMQAPYLSLMQVPQGWSLARGDSMVTIAVVDGGTYWQHEDIFPNIWVNTGEDINQNGKFDPMPPPQGDLDGIDNDGNGFIDDVIGWNFANNSNNPNGLASQPANSAHGTATASLFGAVTNNVKGIAGTSWNCRVMPICAASLVADRYISVGVMGIWYAFTNGARVITCSWGGYPFESLLLRDVLAAADESGAVVLAAAGNNGMDIDVNPFYPANDRSVLAVGATRSVDDAKAYFSNYGMGVSVFAPATDVWGALNGGGYGNVGQGTSLASPITAGLAGLLASLHPGWSAAQIRTQTRVTADTIDGLAANSPYAGSLGHGRVNFFRALSETTHVGLEVVSADLHSGLDTTLYTGDEVSVKIKLKNVLFAAAGSPKFTLSSSDPAVEITSGSCSLPTIQPGEEVTLPPFGFRILSLSSPRMLVLRLAWMAANAEHDAFPIRAIALPDRPQWALQVLPNGKALMGVKAVDAKTAWAVGNDSINSFVLRTVDGGHFWNQVAGTVSEAGLRVIEALDSNRAWVSGGTGKIWATSDAGATWNVKTYSGPQAPVIIGMQFVSQTTGFALGNPPSAQGAFVVLRTTDEGETWAHLPVEPFATDFDKTGYTGFHWTDERHGWIGTNRSKVLRTADGGQTWKVSYPGLWIDFSTAAKPFSLGFSDSLHGLAFHPFPFLWRTTDGGSTWLEVPNENIVVASDGGIAAISGRNQVWRAANDIVYGSIDGGASWRRESTYPLTGMISHIGQVSWIQNGTLHASAYAVTSTGEILRRQDDVIDGAPPSDAPRAREWALSQNFPNPFNPSTEIQYTIHDRQSTSIKIFDLLGREVASLVNEVKAPGQYSVTWNASGMASGVYFCRMRAGEFVQTIRLMLLK
jgi:photosystem II stability/assembly factor-like uncharacterized protein